MACSASFAARFIKGIGKVTVGDKSERMKGKVWFTFACHRFAAEGLCPARASGIPVGGETEAWRGLWALTVHLWLPLGALDSTSCPVLSPFRG